MGASRAAGVTRPAVSPADLLRVLARLPAAEHAAGAAAAGYALRLSVADTPALPPALPLRPATARAPPAAGAQDGPAGPTPDSPHAAPQFWRVSAIAPVPAPQDAEQAPDWLQARPGMASFVSDARLPGAPSALLVSPSYLCGAKDKQLRQRQARATYD